MGHHGADGGGVVVHGIRYTKYSRKAPRKDYTHERFLRGSKQSDIVRHLANGMVGLKLRFHPSSIHRHPGPKSAF